MFLGDLFSLFNSTAHSSSFCQLIASPDVGGSKKYGFNAGVVLLKTNRTMFNDIKHALNGHLPANLTIGGLNYYNYMEGVEYDSKKKKKRRNLGEQKFLNIFTQHYNYSLCTLPQKYNIMVRKVKDEKLKYSEWNFGLAGDFFFFFLLT